MSMIGRTVLSLFALLLSALGSFAYGESVEKSDISFSFPYRCSSEESNESKRSDSVCLADSFEAKLNVILVSKKGNCCTETADTFKDEHASYEFKATHLTRIGNCLTEDDQKRFSVAVVGIGPSEVHVIEPKTDKSALSEDIELKARKIASSAYQEIRAIQEVRDVADSPPDVFSVGNTAFLLFKCTDTFLNQDGLPILVLKNNAFLLEGSCAFRSPFFFSVKKKLYVSYWATVACCGCGDSNFFVYDLSGESPKLVYKNSNFSD
jgi:hypothetical protein